MSRKEDEERVSRVRATNYYLFSLCCFLFFLIAWVESGFACSLGWFVAAGCFSYAAFSWALKIK